ncbi:MULTISPECIES: ABC transporter permease [Haloferax]|uniref:ABC transporter permease n=2 Tax=Haloferax gibbonsii TaxID=35746 RepID=A0A0K1IWX4_HALGI|nr:MULTISPECIES: ABC transporter permease [Haloferax]AKU08976.1 ABC transporter permease [Haloferax gibbonsii]ELZ81983.1 ABC transporter permease [Haloferax gibbonsii ATCC 33959]QOS13235.1 ABC-type transport system permease protein [Haloferax gibbonsii]RDZ54013.1 ABC transporter permease [Haloferax sp. Atlit-4N]REA06329.1 ABC transporter permease [Haloferax sp. Atlit-6N]
MTLESVARKDFRDALRSRWLLGLTLFFALLIGGSTALFYGVLLSGAGANSETLFGLTTAPGGLFNFSYAGMLGFVLALIALVTAHGSLIDERESGTIKLLLSLPNSRRDVVFGKLVGRTLVVIISMLVGFVVALFAMLFTGGQVMFVSYAGQVALSGLLATAFVSIGVWLSATSASQRQALFGTVGLYFIFAVLWSTVATGVPRLVNWVIEQLGLTALTAPQIVQMRLFIKYLNPLRAYETLVAELYGPAVAARLFKAGLGERLAIEATFSEALPFYFTGPFILAILLAWIVVPPLLGYRAFQKADL